jgi:hypothetical protein
MRLEPLKTVPLFFLLGLLLGGLFGMFLVSARPSSAGWGLIRRGLPYFPNSVVKRKASF